MKLPGQKICIYNRKYLKNIVSLNQYVFLSKSTDIITVEPNWKSNKCNKI